MGKPVDLNVVRSERDDKKRCRYCAALEHPTDLSCPRLGRVDFDPETGNVLGVVFIEAFEASATVMLDIEEDDGAA